MQPAEPTASAEIVDRLRASLAAAERALIARDKTIHALVTREKDRTAKFHSTFGAMEENSTLQKVVASKTLELEAQNHKLEQATRDLQETSSLLEVLLDNTPVYIFFKDQQSRFVRCSKSLQDVVRQSGAAALKGKTDFDFFVESYAREALADEQAILRSGEPIIGKIEKVQHADGRTTWSLTTKMPWRDPGGRIIGTFGVSSDITAIKASEAELEVAHKQLVEASRAAGMAEVATNVLHNVGNVLNSVNVSASLAVESLKNSRAVGLVKVVALLGEHRLDLGDYLSRDPKGQHIPAFLEQLSRDWLAQQESLVKELESLRGNIDHIKGIVAMQQSYAKGSGATEIVNLRDLVEDSLRMDEGALIRHQVQVVREFEEVPPISVEKHKVLQILVNLIRNAKHACTEQGGPDKRIRLRIMQADGRIRISVSDNGVGIAPENLTRIFAHGFTTRKDGHGFGLNSGALAATELGGSLSAQSDGPGQGATFTLELPQHRGGPV